MLRQRNMNAWPDFHTLTAAQVDKLVDQAKAAKYRKPKNANGSTARYYYAKLERESRREHIGYA